MLFVTESRILRILFGPNKDKVTGRWRKLHNEKLHDYQVEEDEVGGACGANGGEKEYV
jgi:hypothetical protein